MRQALTCVVLLCGFAPLRMNAQMEMSVGGNQSITGAILQPVAGEPYQAEKLTSSKQTLSDGTVITHETTGLIARDAQGRMREDLYIVNSAQVNGQEQDMSLQSATVGDPVAHTMLIWTGETSKIAMKMDLPTLPTTGLGAGGVMGGVSGPPPLVRGTGNVVALHEDAPPPVRARPSGLSGNNNMPNLGSPAGAGGLSRSKDQVHTEELGQQSFEGILVTGKRTTTTIPLGEVGNDRPIVVVHEEWRSPELRILVKTMDTDPRTGVQTMELQNLVRTDPDEALFQAPAGYKVQDMAEMMKGLGDLGKTK